MTAPIVWPFWYSHTPTRKTLIATWRESHLAHRWLVNRSNQLMWFSMCCGCSSGCQVGAWHSWRFSTAPRTKLTVQSKRPPRTHPKPRLSLLNQFCLKIVWNDLTIAVTLSSGPIQLVTWSAQTDELMLTPKQYETAWVPPVLSKTWCKDRLSNNCNCDGHDEKTAVKSASKQKMTSESYDPITPFVCMYCALLLT